MILKKQKWTYEEFYIKWEKEKKIHVKSHAQR